MASSHARRPRSFLQYLADNNPFYLLSAASMLLACLLLSNTTTWSPIALHKLVALIVTLNVYELLLVGLGLYLVVRRGHSRDGVMLLVLEAVFLADVGFLNSEVYTESLRAGLLVNGLLLALTAAKLAVVFRVLRMPLASPVFGLALVTMTALLGHAAVFKLIGDRHQGRLPDGVLYAAWWGVCGLMIAYALVTRWTAADRFRGGRAGVTPAAIGHVLVSLMLASLAGHLGTSHWIYSCPFQAADLSPVLIGLTFLLAGVRTGAFVPRRDLAGLCALLPVAAVFTSLRPTLSLTTNVDFAGSMIAVTPLVLAATAAYLTLVYCFAIGHFVRYAALGLAAAVAYATGPTWAAVQQAGDRVYAWLSETADRWTPRTQGAWGTLALVGAFVLLAAGAFVSLWKPKDPGADAASSNRPAAPPGTV